MKKLLKENLVNLAIMAGFAVYALVGQPAGWLRADESAANFGQFFGEMIGFMPAIFVLIGLIDVWVPKERIQKHIGPGSGAKGTLYVILLAMFQAGPLYGAFPIALLLWNKGCSVRNIFVFLGAFSVLKIPMLSFEIGFLGLKFSLLRTLVTLPLFILIGVAMERLLKGREFKVENP